MKLANNIFAVALASLISTSAVLADDVGQDILYGSETITIDFNQMPATAAGYASKGVSTNDHTQVDAIPDYLEGVNTTK